MKILCIYLKKFCETCPHSFAISQNEMSFLKEVEKYGYLFFSLLVFLHEVKVANLNDCHISDILAHFFLMGQSWLQRNWGHYTSCLQIFFRACFS